MSLVILKKLQTDLHEIIMRTNMND